MRDDWIELSDGVRLFARTTMPREAQETPVPAILEYLPYHLTDRTAFGDSLHHPYFAGHGYASVRVDMRGTGNSDGILLDEYLPQEQLDAREVIAWLAGQQWCSGRAGIFAKSWGGFNGLQIAARRPPALRAVISVYSTDDRYADDVHYMGGCLLAHEALSWGSFMLGLNALPPDPAVVRDRWREIWRRRLEQTPFFVEAWLAHQRRDDFWRQGSICEDYGALDCPVLLVGGWADGYKNAVGRAVAGLSEAGVPCRRLVGPWSHGWPEIGYPGPQVGVLQECVRWWDHCLKEVANGALDGPLLRAWMQEYAPPAAFITSRAGRWVGEEEWPSKRLETRRLYPQPDGQLSTEPDLAGSVEHRGSGLGGADGGAWCPYGYIADLPTDQRAEDGLSLSFTTGPLEERLEILGRPEAVLELAVDRTRALVAVRLCNVASDGASLLVARGLLNLTHRDGHVAPLPVQPGEKMLVRVLLDFAGHSFAPGHRIRLGLSSTYWPFAWPSPEPVTLEVNLGDRTRLLLPVRPARPSDDSLTAFEAPEHSAGPRGRVSHRPSRSIRRDVGPGQLEIDVGEEEDARLDDSELEFGERALTRYAITDGDPLTARVQCDEEQYLRRDPWRVRVLARTALSSSLDELLLTMELDAYEGDRRVHSARRTTAFPRDGV